MKVSFVLVAIVLVIVGIYFVSQRSGAVEITQTGNGLSIAIGEHRLEAVEASGEYCDSMLVVGGVDTWGKVHFSTLLSVIPLDTAEALANQYGDFRRCGSPGAAAGMRSVEPMILYAATPAVERTLKKINKMALDGKDPVIEMRFTCLEIVNHTIDAKGHEIDVTSHTENFLDTAYLVKDVKILRKGL
jgi:hypothetical protein